MIRQYLLLLMGAGVSALASLLVGIMTSTETLAIFLILQVLAGLGACIYALASPLRFPGRPHGHQVQPDPQQQRIPKPSETPPPPVLVAVAGQPIATAEPAPARTQTPVPSYPFNPLQKSAHERPAVPADFEEPRRSRADGDGRASLFDGPRGRYHSPIFDDLFGVYRAPNQPTPLDDLPPLEPESTIAHTQSRPWETSPSPWDDEPLPAAEPIQTGPMLPRRPATADERPRIEAVYEETGSLNATIRRVYGSKDAKTHAWTKEALGL